MRLPIIEYLIGKEERKVMLKDRLPEERVSRILNLSGNEISSISGTIR